MYVSEFTSENSLETEVIDGPDWYEWLVYNDDEGVNDGLPENNEIQAENNVFLPPVNFAQEDVIQNEPQVMQQENNNEFFFIDDVIMQQHD